MDKRLIEEIEGILAWAVEGCLKWQKSGLCVPDVIAKAVAMYRKDEDIIGHFLDECANTKINEETRTAEMYRVYQNWALVSGYKPLGKQRFNEQMEDHGLFRTKKSYGDVWESVRVST